MLEEVAGGVTTMFVEVPADAVGVVAALLGNTLEAISVRTPASSTEPIVSARLTPDIRLRAESRAVCARVLISRTRSG